MERDKMYIGGEWVNSIDEKTFDVLNPYAQETLCEVPLGTEEDADRAVEAASKAFEEWADTLVTTRINYLTEAAQIIRKRRNELIQILVKEGGVPISVCKGQFALTQAYLNDTIRATTKYYGETIPSLTKRFSLTFKEPIGVVACITPWNVPFLSAIMKVVPALLAGNTVVLKPASETPINALKLTEIFEECGLPKGVFNVVTGLGPVVGRRLVEHPEVKKISFTGDTETGRDIAVRAGKTLKKVTLELGGSDPVIICEDADLDCASDAVIYGRFLHQGQLCIATKRIILLERIAEEFKEKMIKKTKKLKTGDPMNPQTQIGPLINKIQLEKIDQQVKDSLKEGAKLLVGGEHENLIYKPTILDRCTNEMACCREECFGPVAPLITVPNFDSAIKAANDAKYGLSSGIFTNNIFKALKAAKKIKAGCVHINDCSTYLDPFAPFGGVKASGYGKEGGGHYGFGELTETKWVTFTTTRTPYPFL